MAPEFEPCCCAVRLRAEEWTMWFAWFLSYLQTGEVTFTAQAGVAECEITGPFPFKQGNASFQTLVLSNVPAKDQVLYWGLGYLNI